ncbi:FliM/FliN family flagellar motor C-terminal domain-containing protein [Ralstonia sp. 1138]|uniref:FliM/FliN family flagellar motor C-terminal domain-containing protein n=1 Tax=Ralstonia sp. 1138 TaxID=3156423 RepID=UPI0033969B43
MNAVNSLLPVEQRCLAAAQEAAFARPLVWWSEGQLERLVAGARTLFAQWVLDWGLPGAAPGPEVAHEAVPVSVYLDTRDADSARLVAGPWLALSADLADQGCWWTLEVPEAGVGIVGDEDSRYGDRVREQAAVAVQAALFGASSLARNDPQGDVGSSVAGGVCADAVDDWCARLREWFGANEGDASCPSDAMLHGLPEHVRQPWSGAVWLSMGWCWQRFHLVMDFNCAAHLLGQDSAVSTQARSGQNASGAARVPVLLALADETLSMTVELNPVTIELGNLAGLRIGDVVRTPHALEAPLSVRAEDGTVFCHAFLGKVDEDRAVELLPVDAAN